ncbi:MAG TPA: ATP-dependent 6-phosphofructokinase [Bryobacteraceae bacterium]|nr:ATP-dependent 6-phosphofructokinase [Bryobacteraceae bacterium]
MATRRIGILTGGGDVPGLNSVIKSVTYRSAAHNIEVLGIRRGWEGLTHVNLEDPASRAHYIQPLNRENTRDIEHVGGTMLHSSRTNPSKMRELPDFLKGASVPTDGQTWDLSAQVVKNLEKLGVDALIVIGGDDTLSFAARLDSMGVPVVGVPKTMDNDVRGTEYCIGFSTAITRAIDAVERQRTTVESHERVGVFRVFGRDAGYTALYTAYVTSIRCVIPEYKVNLDKLIDLLMGDKRSDPSNYALVVLSEGASWEGYEVQLYGQSDAYGHRKKASVAEALASEITRRKGEETIASDLTYDLRSGSPDFVDKLVSNVMGTMAFEAIVGGRSGLMAAVQEGRYAMVPLPDPRLGPRHVDIATMYNTERYRPNYEQKLGLPVFLTKA